MEHSRVKCSLLLLIVLVTSKLAPEQNYSAARLELKYLKICQNHQRDPVSGPFSFFYNKMEHPRIEKETRKKQERGNHEPLVSLRRPGSAEQVQFFSVFWSNGGKCEATVKCDSRSKEGKKKHEKTPLPLCTQR